MVTRVTIRDQMLQLNANGIDARNISKYKEKMAHDAGVEPAASAFGGCFHGWVASTSKHTLDSSRTISAILLHAFSALIQLRL